MILASGSLDTKINIEQPSVTRNAIGEVAINWTAFASVWADVIPTTSSEFRGPYIIRNEKKVLFKIRYLPGLRENMRIKHSDRYFNITGVNENGRRESLDVYGELTEAGAPAMP